MMMPSTVRAGTRVYDMFAVKPDSSDSDTPSSRAGSGILSFQSRRSTTLPRSVGFMSIAWSTASADCQALPFHYMVFRIIDSSCQLPSTQQRDLETRYATVRLLCRPTPPKAASSKLIVHTDPLRTSRRPAPRQHMLCRKLLARKKGALKSFEQSSENLTEENF